MSPTTATASPGAPHAGPEREGSACCRAPIWAFVLTSTTLVTGLLAFAGLGGSAMPAQQRHEHHGPLAAHHLQGLPPVCDGIPDPLPGDVWMDGHPTGFLLSFTEQGIWAPMCADKFQDDSAMIACRMLGYQGSASHFNAQLRNLSTPLAPGVQCGGHETSLSECLCDEDFEQKWSDCQRYPEAMAVRLTCYGDIHPAQEKALADAFTDELKKTARTCGSSGILTSLMHEIHNGGKLKALESGAEPVPEHELSAHLKTYHHAPAGPQSPGTIGGSVAAGIGASAIAAGVAAGTQGREGAALRALTYQDGDCSLVEDLKELASMFHDELLSQEEYALAKSKILSRG